MSYIAEKADFQRDFPPEKKLLSLLIYRSYSLYPPSFVILMSGRSSVWFARSGMSFCQHVAR